MKLQEFFDSQKHITCTDIDKLDLYQSILYKKSKKHSLKRMSFIPAKYAVYSMFLMILLVGVYGVYFINNEWFEDYNRFAIDSRTNNTVQADYIAQVIDVEGKFFIEHDWDLIQTNNIGNGDTLLLKSWTQLVFEINSGTQAKVIGPAKLVIQQTHNENYKLNLIYGDFIQMEGNDRKEQTIEVAINDITIKQQDQSQPLNFKFIKNGKNQIFQNNGANIIVTKTNGQQKATTITNNQVVAIQNNDIQVFASIQTFTKAIQDKNISQTFTLVHEDNQTPDKEDTALLSLLATTKIGESNEEITKNISSTLADTNKILEPEQDDKLSSSLYGGSYETELQKTHEAFVSGNEELFAINYTKLEKRIQSIYQVFGLKYTKTGGDVTHKLQWLQSAITSLNDKIQTEYAIPPKYTTSLQSIATTLYTTITKWYASEVTHQAAPETQDTPQQ